LAAGLELTIPERLSVAVNGTDTAVLFQPLTFGAGEDVPKVTTGRVLSILMPDLVTGSLTFPALSVQVPGGELRLVPSAVKVAVGRQLSITDKESLPEKVTTTSLLFPPAAFGAGEAAAVTTGLVLSMLTLTAIDALLPAMSSQVPFTDWIAPSSDNIVSAGGL